MKYYFNSEKEILLIDTNEYTPYLTQRGYHEISKEEYDRLNVELAEKFKDEDDE